MKNREIANIVFYKKDNGQKSAYIFYDDGSVDETSYESAIDKCYDLAKELKISSKEMLQEMINKKIIHVVTFTTIPKNFKHNRTSPPISELITNLIISLNGNEIIFKISTIIASATA